MSISAKKLAACQANAQLSTGPRSIEGKQTASGNSLKHGLSAKQLHVPPALQDTFAQHREALLLDLKPSGAAELDLFEQLLHSSWCLHLIHQAELQLHAESDNPFLDSRLTGQIDRLDRYRSRHQKDYRATLKLIRDLQTDRAVLAQQDPAVTILTKSYPLARFSHLTKRTDRILACDLTTAIERHVTGFLEKRGVEIVPDSDPVL